MMLTLALSRQVNGERAQAQLPNDLEIDRTCDLLPLAWHLTRSGQ